MRPFVPAALLSLSLLAGCGVPVTGSHLSTNRAPVQNFFQGLSLASDGTLHKEASDLFTSDEFDAIDTAHTGRLTKAQLQHFFETQQDPGVNLGDMPISPGELAIIGISGGAIAGYLTFVGTKISSEVMHPGKSRPVAATGGTPVSLTSDGLTLAATYQAAATATDSAVVLCHPIGASKEAMVDYAKVLSQYNVLSFDFRNHGGSQGGVTTGGLLESHDVAAAVAYLKGQGNKHVGALGVGMGAVAALDAASAGAGLDGVFSDSAYTALTDDMTRRAKAHHFPLSSFAGQAATVILGLRTHTSPNHGDAINNVGNLSRTITFFTQMSSDPNLAGNSAQVLHDASTLPTFMWLASGKGASTLQLDPTDYAKNAQTFFQRAFNQ
jgi:pimeloyl-ACP methyl ester carboxylesterase